MQATPATTSDTADLPTAKFRTWCDAHPESDWRVTYGVVETPAATPAAEAEAPAATTMPVEAPSEAEMTTATTTDAIVPESPKASTQSITGTVEHIELLEWPERARIHQGTAETPIILRCTLALDDGRKAYIETRAARKTEGGSGQAASIFYHLNAHDDRWQIARDYPENNQAPTHGYPWVLRDDGRVYTSQTPKLFPNAACVAFRLVLMVWAGDVLTVRGSVTEKTSRNGAAYLGVKRATVEQWDRPEWAEMPVEAPAPVEMATDAAAPVAAPETAVVPAYVPVAEAAAARPVESTAPAMPIFPALDNGDSAVVQFDCTTDTTSPTGADPMARPSTVQPFSKEAQTRKSKRKQAQPAAAPVATTPEPAGCESCETGSASGAFQCVACYERLRPQSATSGAIVSTSDVPTTGPVVNGEQFAPGYTPEAAAYEQQTREAPAALPLVRGAPVEVIRGKYQGQTHNA